MRRARRPDAPRRRALAPARRPSAATSSRHATGCSRNNADMMPKAPAPAPTQIGRVDAGDGRTRLGQGQDDAGCATKEGHDQHSIDRKEIGDLPEVPDDLKRIERNGLDHAKLPGAVAAKEQGADDEGCGKARLQPSPHQRHEGSARPEAEQGNADDHVGEVVPLNDGEQPNEQDLVGQDPGREERDRQDRHVSAGRARGTNCDRQELARRHSPFRPSPPASGAARKAAADGDDHATARLELLHERRRHGLGSGRDDDAVERCGLGPTVVPVADARHHVRKHLLKPFPGGPGQFGNDLDGMDLINELARIAAW